MMAVPVTPDPRTDVSSVVRDVVDTIREETGCAVSWSAPEGAVARADHRVLHPVLEDLVENAVVHTSRPDPGVTVRVRETENGSEGTAFEVRDDNERIPDIEIDSIRAGDETALQHGTGIGLWLVQWCVTTLNGTLTFEYDDGNVITVVLPAS